ncbi:MAG: type II toxin-antitoxin system Phd/YefM family antitoxin [PVC group bacterium]
MSTQIISASECRKRLPTLIGEVEKVHDHYVITRHGEPAAALISYEEFRSLIATLDVVSDPSLVKDIREDMKCAEKGAVYSFEEVFEEPL